MNQRDADTYRALLAQGVHRETLDRIVAEGERPPARRRTVDRRLLDSALKLDILDARIEAARLEQYEQTKAAMARIGFDASRFRPPLPERLPGEPSHLERALAGAEAVTVDGIVETGLIRRPGGAVLGLR